MTISVLDSRILDINYRYYYGSLDPIIHNAGVSVAEEIQKLTSPGSTVLMICGTGNKAGDAINAAALLRDKRNLKFIFPRGVDHIKSEKTRSIFESLKIDPIRAERISEAINASDLLVDALLGTGITGKPSDDYARIISLMNGSGKPILSIDLPSGFGTEVHILPKVTVTMHAAKEGMTVENSGTIAIKDIGIPGDLVNTSGPGYFLTYPIPEAGSHKGMNGKLGIFAGARYPGAAIVSALGAEKIGLDLIHLYTDPSIGTLVQGYSPFVITVPSADLSRSEENDSLLIGPGNGMNEENDAIMSKLLSLDKPTLLDADGIKTLYRCRFTRRRPLVVTPHRKEFEILTGMEATEENAFSYARKTGNIVLLKGKADIITDGKRIIHSPGGNARMTMGGTGDLLAGIVAALLAKGIDELHASVLGSFLNKKIGETAFLKQSYWFGIMDMINLIPETMAWMYHFCYETRD
jgi:hydroxyethylthiazole kinase-like uncharacterized protein yjeF